ncbi:hypothetical protein PR003_g25714, partial [Phytophthora rubi]
SVSGRCGSQIRPQQDFGRSCSTTEDAEQEAEEEDEQEAVGQEGEEEEVAVVGTSAKEAEE